MKKDVGKSVKRNVYAAIGIISESAGVFIPRDDYPDVELSSEIDGRYTRHRDEHPAEGKVIIKPAGSKEEFLESVGEEAGHFVREYTIAEKGLGEDKKTTSEFFGYLGKRLILEKMGYKARNKMPKKEALGIARFENKKEKIINKIADSYESYLDANQKSIDVLKSRLDRSRDKTEREGLLDQVIGTQKERSAKSKEMYDEKENAYAARSKRESMLVHARGYEFADQMDLSETDLKELYSLEDKEVRKRFFRRDKVYHESHKPKTRGISEGLERKIGVILIILGGLGLFFLSSNITGLIISNSITKAPSLIGSLLFICGLIGVYLLLKKI